MFVSKRTSVLYGYADAGGSYTWRDADSSESETSKKDEDISTESRSGVHFLVGSETTYVEDPSAYTTYKHVRVSSQPPSLRTTNNNGIFNNTVKSGNMVRSYSQDVNLNPHSHENVIAHPKPAQSESSLDSQGKMKSIRQKTIKEQPSVSLEDDICSTDSSLMDEDIKKRKRKIFGFSRRSKTKND